MIKTRKELILECLEFFASKGHKFIPNAPLVPEHDPTVLFTTAGMHPLVPFILGEKHPTGKRLMNVQKCLRTGDIEEVGDESHLTFFEMFGNWGLGDYWKEDAIKFSHDFLTKILKLDQKKIYVTIFSGDKEIPRDTESAKIWQQLGIPKERIHFLGREHNFWGPAGEYGPCGPCAEMFIDTGKPKCSKSCKPGDCGKYVEVGNDVFMEYNKTKKGYEKLKQKVVDDGRGLERLLAILQGKNIFETEIFAPAINKIKKLSGIKKFTQDAQEQGKSARIIADHIKAACFILAEQIFPSNVDRGYILRRLIRRAIRHGRLLGINTSFTKNIAEIFIKIYGDDYPELKRHKDMVLAELEKEEQKFRNTLEKGIKKFEQIIHHIKNKQIKEISGKDTFDLYQSFGFPVEMTIELAREKKLKVDVKEFNNLLSNHQKLSRKGAEQKFKGGLADARYETTRLHTATHLLHQALRDVLGKHVQQKGSNITAERLRFDFSHTQRMSEDEIKEVQDLVNKKIRAGLEVTKKETTLKKALEKGTLAFFGDKYGENVHVYSIGNFSKEVCGGPHVSNTRELGRFKITKEEAVAAGVRRIKAVLE